MIDADEQPEAWINEDPSKNEGPLNGVYHVYSSHKSQCIHLSAQVYAVASISAVSMLFCYRPVRARGMACISGLS